MWILSFFQLSYIGIFLASCVLLVISFLFFRKHKEKFALFALFLFAFLLRLFIALQDPFLHIWDERYHALVARNLMNNPLMPLLRNNPVGGYEMHQWTNSHVWLHKQPLFMWQMALSMKIFGVSDFSIRYPSVLMGSLMVLMIYSIARSLTGSGNIAYCSALIFCFCGHQLKMISGVMGMDHNDIAYGFYVLASIWAYTKYAKEGGFLYVVLVGFFAGCAVLNKWLPGMMVFGAWAVNIALGAPDRKKQVRHFFISVLVCCVVFVPWQLYILHVFPVEAAYEYQFNARHIYEVVEGHGGDNFFYLTRFPVYFGELGWIFVPGGFVILFLRMRRGRLKSPETAIALMVIFSVVFVFFSFIVKTKIENYFFVAVPIGAIFIALAIAEIKHEFALANKPQTGKILAMCIAAVTMLCMFQPDSIITNHSAGNSERMAFIAHASVYKRLKENIPSDVKIILNVNDNEDVTAMFYNDDLIVYGTMFDKHVIDSLIAANEPFAAFESRPSYELPDYITSYPKAFIIHQDLK